MAKSNEPLIPKSKKGDRIRITHVSCAIKNVREGMLGKVLKPPQIVAGVVRVEIELEDGQIIIWAEQDLEVISEEELNKRISDERAQVKDKQNMLIPQSVKENLNNDNQIVSVEVVPDESGIEELTPEEEQDKLRFERQVERAFYSAGVALVQLRDRRLYRNTHSTFESYCRDRFNFGRHTANRLIAAIQVVDNLVTIVTKNQPDENISPQIILPTRESQVRPLVGLEPEKQHQAWTRAIKEAGGKTPTAKKVKEVVEQMYLQVNSKTPNFAHHLQLQPRGLVEINTPHLIALHQRYGRIHLIHQSTVEVWVRNMSSMTMRKQTLKHQQVQPVPFEKESQLLEVR